VGVSTERSYASKHVIHKDIMNVVRTTKKCTAFTAICIERNLTFFEERITNFTKKKTV
jgi:hypothetical protein